MLFRKELIIRGTLLEGQEQLINKATRPGFYDNRSSERYPAEPDRYLAEPPLGKTGVKHKGSRAREYPNTKKHADSTSTLHKHKKALYTQDKQAYGFFGNQHKIDPQFTFEPDPDTKMKDPLV